MSLVLKINRLERLLSNNNLEAEWLHFWRSFQAYRGRKGEPPLTDEQLSAMAKRSARCGQRPGDVLARYLIENAQKRASGK